MPLNINDLSENDIINPIFNVSNSLILPSISDSFTTSESSDDNMSMSPIYNIQQSNGIELPPLNINSINSNLEINNTNFPPLNNTHYINGQLLVSSVLGNLDLSPIQSFVNYDYLESSSSDDLSEMEEGKISNYKKKKKKKKKNIFTFSFLYTGKKVKKITI